MYHSVHRQPGMALRIRATSARREASGSCSRLQARVTTPMLQATAPRPSGSQKRRRLTMARRVCEAPSHRTAGRGSVGSSVRGVEACGCEEWVSARLMPPHRAKQAKVAVNKLKFPPSRTIRVVRVAPSIPLPSLQFAAASSVRSCSPGVEFRMAYGAIAPPGLSPQAACRAVLRPGYLISLVTGSGAGLRLGVGSCRRV